MRAELLREVRGRVLEIGGGTGLNLARYPDTVTSLQVLEPDQFMRRHLTKRLADEPPAFEVEVLDASALDLPFDDASFETVVSTLVLCTVPDPVKVASELRRVLAPGGRLLFIEHVRDPDEGRLARWQDRLERPWGWFAGGCHPNRDTAATLRAAGFELDASPGQLPKAPPIVEPLLHGTARVAASAS